MSLSGTDDDRFRLSGCPVLVLPGGRWQLDVIRLLQKLGARVICADGTPCPPGSTLADVFVQVPLQDIDALCRIGREHGVEAVLTDQTDFAVPIAAEVAARLKLRGLPIDVALCATNKGLMRERLRGCNVAQPQFRVCGNIESFIAAVRELGPPLFYKPVDGQSSRGVGPLFDVDEDDLQSVFRRASEASSTRAVIVERLLTGTECTVEGFVFADGPRTLAISSKTHYPDLPGVAKTLTYPPALPPEVTDRVRLANEEVMRALGIPFGITHAEFIVDSQGAPYLVEIAARGGGSRISSHIVPAVTGFDPLVGLIRQLFSRPVVCPRLSQRAAELRFLRLETRARIAALPNLESLRSRPGILDLFVQFGPGDVVPSVSDDRSRHGYVISAGTTREEAVRNAEAVENDLVCVYEYGAAQ